MKYELINPINTNYSVIEQIFFNRNIDIEKIDTFINPPAASIHSYKLLQNILLASEILIHHLNQGNKIFIQVDSDCDGYTSSAILINWIYNYNPKAYKNITFRIHEGKQHGLSNDSLDYILQNKYSLVILPDAGSNQVDVHKILSDNNIQCIVIDHHEADILSVRDAVIINPKLDNYPNKELSGAAVVYKFCQMLDEYTSCNHADNLLDLVAIGLVADMMDTKNLETRRLILLGLNNIHNKFLTALIEKQSYSMKNEITPTTIGFYIGPLINAVVRAGTQEEKECVFGAFLESNSNVILKSTKRGADTAAVESLIEYACRVVTNVKSRQAKIRDRSVSKAEELIEDKQLSLNKIIAVIVEDDLDKNLSGLVANKLINKYQRPALILRRTSGQLLQGSARGYEKSELSDFKEFLNSSNLVEYAEGHANAFGIRLREENLIKLIDYCNTKLPDTLSVNKFLVDYVFDIKNLKESDVFDIHSLRALWGRGFEEPTFCVTSLKLTDLDISLLSAEKNPTLKFSYKNFSFIKFGSSKKEYEDLRPSNQGSIEVDVVGRFSLNEWNQNSYPQILIEDYEKKSEMQYYF